jgi:hypothetical protein
VANLQAVYYRAADGTEPVNDFIEQLSAKRQVAVDNQVDRLNMLTPANPHLPSSKRGWKPSRVGSREQRVTTLLELLTNFGKVRSAHA